MHGLVVSRRDAAVLYSRLTRHRSLYEPGVEAYAFVVHKIPVHTSRISEISVFAGIHKIVRVKILSVAGVLETEELFIAYAAAAH